MKKENLNKLEKKGGQCYETFLEEIQIAKIEKSKKFLLMPEPVQNCKTILHKKQGYKRSPLLTVENISQSIKHL